MTLLRNKEYNISRNLSESEKQLGVDLKLTLDNDLELNNLKDFSLIAGGGNAAQAIKINLELERGSLPHHQEKGTDLLIGNKNTQAFNIKSQIISSLSSDPRFDNVDVKVSVLGSTIFLELVVILANTGIEVPLQFVVQR